MGQWLVMEAPRRGNEKRPLLRNFTKNPKHREDTHKNEANSGKQLCQDGSFQPHFCKAHMCPRKGWLYTT